MFEFWKYQILLPSCGVDPNWNITLFMNGNLNRAHFGSCMFFSFWKFLKYFQIFLIFFDCLYQLSQVTFSSKQKKKTWTHHHHSNRFFCLKAKKSLYQILLLLKYLFFLKQNLIIPGYCRVTIEKDTKVPNACLFTVSKEDHTLGNLIRMWVINFSFFPWISLVNVKYFRNQATIKRSKSNICWL